MKNDTESRPVVTLTRSPLEVALEVAAFIGFSCSIAIVLPYWAHLPDSIPLHFGIGGKPDEWGAKAIIWFFPAIATVMYLAMTITSFFPHTFNYPVQITQENAIQQYQIALKLIIWLKTELLWLFVFIEWQIIQVALEESQELNILVLLTMMLIIFVTVGFYLRKAYLAR